MALHSAIKDAFGFLMELIGMFVNALTSSEGTLNALLPVFVIGVGVSVLLLGIKVVKSMTWGA